MMLQCPRCGTIREGFMAHGRRQCRCQVCSRSLTRRHVVEVDA